MIFGISAYPQEQSKVDFNGYLSGMPQFVWSDTTNIYQVLVNNRLNFHWYPGEKVTASLQMRNQLLYGGLVEQGNYENGFQQEAYFLPLTFTQSIGSKGLAYTAIDRLWLQYTINNLEVKLGRQRINWGQTFAWNPNDIFNTYNFFDFDYIEKPGADAVRLQYYPNYTSTIELAAKIDSANQVTTAALYRLNKWGFDFQFMGGYYSQSTVNTFSTYHTESDWVAGFGLTCDFWGFSLRTESTYLKPTKNSPNQKEQILTSIGLDKGLENELYLSCEYFYSNRPSTTLSGGQNGLQGSSLSLKTMAFAKHNAFAQFSYPLTPLINTSFSAMFFKDKGISGNYLGPSLDYSVKSNIDISLVLQIFNFKVDIPQYGSVKSNINFAFLRAKWSF